MLEDFFEMHTPTGKPREIFMLMDISNHMHRNRHGAMKAGDDEDINEYAMHLAFAGLNKLYREIQPTKIVAAIDHGSWRKEVLPMYKAGRHELRKEDLGFKKFLEGVKEFTGLLKEYSSIICLDHDRIEADDWIGRWIQTHPDDIHVIVSSDGDFHQMHAHNVTQYNPVAKKWIEVEDPKFAIFLKCIRGETAKTSDNIPSAYPRVPTKKLQQAFDGDTFLMETIMQHQVPNIADLDNEGHPKMATTKQLYDRNRHLMDLSQQPQEIIDSMDLQIKTARDDVGKFDMFHVLRFLGKNNLQKIADNIDGLVPMLSL